MDSIGPGGNPRRDNGGGESRTIHSFRALQKATDEKRANLLADIVGHPEQMPSVEELDYMNPSLGSDSIRRHLKILMSVGVVEERELPPGERRRDYPYKFYTLTSEARALFDESDLFPREPWNREYMSVEKTSRITDVETLPRPD